MRPFFILILLLSFCRFALPQTFTAIPDLSQSLKIIVSTNRDLKINEVMTSNISILKDEYGQFDDWIELYNYSDDTVNINGLYISDSRKNLKKFCINADTLIAPKKYLILWADEEGNQGPLHLPFKLDGTGERVYISDEEHGVLDSVIFGEQMTNISYGRLKDDFLLWNYFESPTPGKENADSGLLKITEPPNGNLHSGYYTEPICFEIDHPDESVKIRYTINGDVPDESSEEYSQCIFIDTTTVIRFRSFKTGCLPGRTQTRTFFFEKDKRTLDAVSIAINTADLTGPSGIFKLRNTEMEKAIHVEYFGSDEKMKFNIDGGMQLHSPKRNQQYSLRLYARSDYGFEDMNYPIFDSKRIYSFNRLILRNGGNDGTASRMPLLTHFRDGLHHILFALTGNNQATSAYHPVNVYINGEYYGIYNAREKIDRNFIEANYGFSGDIDLLEYAFGYPGNRYAVEGSFQLYDSLTRFMNNNDISLDENYNVVEKLMDVDKYIDYWIHEVYIGNFDWLCNNIKIYRPNNEDGRFSWILWDTDHGSGLPYGSYGKPEWRTLNWSLSTDQTRNAGGLATIIQRNLAKNQGFRQKFVNRYADLLNTVYSYNVVEKVIDSVYLMLQKDMVYHCSRWNVSYNGWLNAVEAMKDFHKQRPDFVIDDIKKCFLIEKTCTLTLKTNNQQSGVIRINTIVPAFNENTWKGVYFSGIPVTLEAIPNEGYQFDGWKFSSVHVGNSLVVHLTSDSIVEAVFSPCASEPLKIIINEIGYANQLNSAGGDWIEIVNHTGDRIFLKNWKLKAGNREFVLGNVEMEDNDFLLITSDKSRIHQLEGKNIVLLNQFEIDDEGSVLRLLNDSGIIVDEVEFKSNLPWPVLAGEGLFSLELIDPQLDNARPGNWKSSAFINGTPGLPNSSFNHDLRNIVINEVMAVNRDICVDDYGDSDDWIELYNRGKKTIDIRGLFISDDGDDPLKYQIPDPGYALTINPCDFLLLWADDETYQGPLHLNYKLNGEGEKVTASYNNGYEIIEIDRIKYGPQSSYYSYGREYDGVGFTGSDFTFLDPTPNASNSYHVPLPTSAINQDSESGFSFYPVPAFNELFIEITGNEAPDKLTVDVINMFGIKQEVSIGHIDKNIIYVQLQSLKPGLYLFCISDRNGNRYIRKVIKL